ncbi:MAG: efflux RND transporter periplasmic adaptor subunit [Bacteroidia bacterium]|nr:efflux RND transporter periplasmic adaptor subunit [Bacteroidia bacterium]
MKNLRIFLILAVLVGLLAFIKIKFLTKEQGPGGPGAGPGGPNKDAPVLVTGFVVQPDTLSNEVYISGSLVANEQVELLPEIPGRVVKIGFTEGSKVSQGQLLVKINDADLQANLKKLRLQEKLISENVERRKKLLAVSGISQEEYDAAVNQLATCQADILLTESQIAKTEIKAPFSGSIGIKNISLGAVVNSATPIATLVQTDPLKIDFSIPEKYSHLIKIGQTIHFNLDGEKQPYSAKVQVINPKIDENTRTIQVRALANNPGGRLIPGGFAEIQLPLKQSSSAVMVPTQAIIPILKGQKVFLSKNGIAQESKVETGFRNDKKVQILSGVSLGDTIIVSGLLSVKPGSKLKFTSSKN